MMLVVRFGPKARPGALEQLSGVERAWTGRSTLQPAGRPALPFVTGSGNLQSSGKSLYTNR